MQKPPDSKARRCDLCTIMGYIKGLWGYIEVTMALYRDNVIIMGYIGVTAFILGKYRGYIGTMEKNMETTGIM